MIFSKAPGKIILFGEHAVVYGQPAIAMPVTYVNATTRISPNIQARPGLIKLQAPDIQLDSDLSTMDPDHPLAAAVLKTLEALKLSHVPSFTLQINATIPIAAGMGSSAAISVAVIRAVSNFLGKTLPDAEVSALAFEVEKIQHGSPSGIDNHVIAYQLPVFFIKDQPVEFLSISHPTHWVIADSGESTPTRDTVQAVRALYTEKPDQYNAIFQSIGSITHQAKHALMTGDNDELGSLLNQNQVLLARLTVSSPKLESLVQAACNAGALGAKLSGSGRGGNMIALVQPNQAENVKDALKQAGAVSIITTQLSKQKR